MAAGPVPGTVWERLEDDEDGAIYYYNTSTNDVTWDKPEEVAAAEAAEDTEVVEAEPAPGEDTAEEDLAADAADMAARVRAMKAKRAAVDAVERDSTASAADMAARVREMTATKATGSRAMEAAKPVAAELAAHDAAQVAAGTPAAASEVAPEREVRVQAARSEEASVGLHRLVSGFGLLTPARPASTFGLDIPQLGRGHAYSLYDAQPHSLFASAPEGTPTAAAAAAAAAAAMAAEARAETKRHEERIAWSQGSMLGMPPGGQSPVPRASLMGTPHAPSRMVSPWADAGLLQTDRVQEKNDHLTSVSAGDCGMPLRVARNVFRVESPDVLQQRLTRLQTENTVLRDRLAIAESALDSLRIYGEQERCAREAMHATLVASENSRALLREELVQTRGVQRELEAELAEVRRQVSELSLF